MHATLKNFFFGLGLHGPHGRGWKGNCPRKDWKDWKKGCGNWKAARGKLSKLPETVLLGSPNETILGKVYIKNTTQWPYKAGCQLVSIFDQSIQPFLEEVRIPVEQVQANAEFSIDIPLIFKIVVPFQEPNPNMPLPAPLVAKFSL